MQRLIVWYGPPKINKQIEGVRGFWGSDKNLRTIEKTISILQLWGNGIYWTLSIVVLSINIFINIGMKQWIREPRPVGGQIMTTYDTYTGVLDYGMPSGHSQMAFGLVTFVYLVKQSISFLIGGTWIIGLTVYQRWKYKRHSIEQLAVGAIVGILVAYISYTLITMEITGQ